MTKKEPTPEIEGSIELAHLHRRVMGVDDSLIALLDTMPYEPEYGIDTHYVFGDRNSGVTVRVFPIEKDTSDKNLIHAFIVETGGESVLSGILVKEEGTDEFGVPCIRVDIYRSNEEELEEGRSLKIDNNPKMDNDEIKALHELLPDPEEAGDWELLFDSSKD